MKIRNRLTLIYAIAAIIVMTVLGELVYYFTVRFHQQEFAERLEGRVQVTEQIFLEKDEVLGQAVRDKFLQRLDEEEEYVITLKQSGLDSLDDLFYRGLSKDISTSNSLTFNKDKRQGVAKIYDLPNGKFAVVVTAVDVFGKTKLDFLKKILIIGMLLGLAILVMVGWFSSQRALRPLETKIKKASEISASNLNLRLEVRHPDDEIGELTIAFNRMLDRIQAGFESQRGFVANASHEIRNPLTAIIGEADLLLERDRPIAEYKATLQNIVTEAERLQKLANQLLELSKAEAMDSLSELHAVPLDQLLLETLDRFPAERVKLDFEECKSEPIVNANPPLLQTAFSNIIDNALKYSENQLITIEFQKIADEFQVKVSDKGIGISAEDLKHIYVPLFRSRNARKLRGHGVGLPLARRIILLHKGRLLVTSNGEAQGTEVTITLPAHN
ncbi:MAG: HAMP domain-containing histidine kinase [Saprospiraceae bacterium]|nr:HAMP domain-containing histidine kinase [Saprospiraceae bacterium]